MKRWRFLLTVLVLLGILGCGNDQERGKNKDKESQDRPRGADKND